MFFAIATAILTGIDLYLSSRRIEKYGPLVELNPVARQLAQSSGPWAGLAFLGMWNAAILIALVHYHADVLLHILFGAKLGLAAMQAKSLETEYLVEKILSAARRKNVQKVNHSK